MNKRATSLIVSTALLAGGAGGFALGLPNVVGAQDAPAEAPATNETPRLDAWRQEALAPLVADGTITQGQADAVIAALDAARPERGEGHGRGVGKGMGIGRGQHLETVATALGMTTDEVRTAVRDGSSIADLAASKGVDVQVVIDALVIELDAKLAEKVAGGDLTQEEADAKKAEAVERITAMVNRELPAGRSGPRGPRGPR